MKTRRWPALPVVVAALLMTLSSTASAQVLQQVPADALVVIKVRNLQDVSTKASGLMQAMGVANLSPAMADPLAAMQQQTGIANGLDKNGDVAIYVPSSVLDKIKAKPAKAADPQAEAAEEEAEEPAQQQLAVMLWPITDYKAFIANFPEAQTEGEISTFKMGENPNDSYAANWGKYAAVSQVKELVATKPTNLGLKVAGLAAKELDTKDITMFFNVAPARAKLLPKLKESRPQIIAEMKEKMGAEEAQAKYVPIAEAAVNGALDLVEQLLNETNAATYAINLTNEGINTTSMAEFDPKSKFGQRAARIKGAGGSMLTGLPEGKYLLFGGGQLDPKIVTETLDDLLKPIEGELAKLGPDGKAINDYIAAARQAIAASQSSRFGMVAPAGQLGQEAIMQMINIATGDGKAMYEAQKKMFAASDAITALAGQGKVQSKLTLTPNAKTVAGVQLDQFQSTVSPTSGPADDDAGAAEAAQMKQMMAMMYGPNGITGYTGLIDNKTLVTVTGASDELLEKAVTAAKGNADVLGKMAGVVAVNKHLPQNRNLIVYLPLDQMITTGLTYAQQFGMPVQLQLPADLPPIGFTVGAEGSALRADSHIPAQLVQSLIAAGMQAFMQMQGGQQPGGPGGL
ncbi:MAG: hypothetical protein M3478_09300 [Planctomycetota bacterium]|nr:hypothetical protein [Planctomycetota bacterium]